jgi:hypothetical protein
LLGDGDEADLAGIESFDDFCKISQRTRQAVDLIYDYGVDLAGVNVG